VPLTGVDTVDPQAPLTGALPSRPPPDEGVSVWPPAGTSPASPPPTGSAVVSSPEPSTGPLLVVWSEPPKSPEPCVAATPWARASTRCPAVASFCSICCLTCGDTFDPPTAEPLSNRAPQVAGPTMPSTCRPARLWYWRTAVSVCTPKIPSAGT
jgi:hypothetical protein